MPPSDSPQPSIVGWDIGGAHLKAASVAAGHLHGVAQWPCELWRGMSELDNAFDVALTCFPVRADTLHAVTMTGEMTDLFDDRESGVMAIARCVARVLGERTAFFAADGEFVQAADVHRRWRAIASANWSATARLIANTVPDALLVDVGSTTTDIVPIVGGRVASRARDDADRLACGELVYVGVVRTPLCALAHRIDFGGRECNVMNEFFATTADVFRLTGELRAEHDQAGTADHAGKDVPATRRRLARMIGRDARDASDEDWVAFARAWRTAVIDEIAANVERVVRDAKLAPDAPVIGVGCGSDLASRLAVAAGRRYVDFDVIAGVPADAGVWARVCAPSVAVALLLNAHIA